MRRGQDRHAVGEAVCALMFPDEAPTILGASLGSTVTALTERFGEPSPGSPAVFAFPVEDPVDNKRVLEVRVFHRQGRVHILDGRFYSEDRMDVDSAYRTIRKHLKSAHGKPDKEMTGTLKFLYDVAGPPPCRTSICRYRDAEGRNVLEVSTKVRDGHALPAPQPRKLSNAKR